MTGAFKMLSENNVATGEQGPERTRGRAFVVRK